MEQAASDYRPVSRLAVLAAALGGLSALAVVSPVCWVLPLIAGGVSLAALADIRRGGSRKAGGLAAVAGLGLAVGFGGQAAGDAVATRWLVTRRAAATARYWIDAVRAGRLGDALSVCGPRAGGIPTGVAAETARSFGGLAAVRALADCGPAVAPVITTVAAAEDGGWIVRAALAACGRSGETLRIAVVPETVPRPGGSVDRWLVTDFAVER